MPRFLHTYLLAGVAAVGATAVVLAPVQVTPPEIAVTAAQRAPDPTATHEVVQLLAAVQGMAVRPTPESEVRAALQAGEAVAAMAADPAPRLLDEAATARATDEAPLVVAPVAFPGVANTIKDVYTTVEEVAAYGVELVQWAIGWVPLVGLLSGRIGIFYDFGEAIVRSVVFNFADWVGGTVGFGEGVANIANDTGQAVSDLIQDEIDWVRGLFPPLPPISTASSAPVLKTASTTMTSPPPRSTSRQQAPARPDRAPRYASR